METSWTKTGGRESERRMGWEAWQEEEEGGGWVEERCGGFEVSWPWPEMDKIKKIRELISARLTPHEHNNKDLSRLRYL